MSDDMEHVLDTIRFWQQIQGDAKRTLCCTPEDAPRIQALVDQHDAGHIFTVRSSAGCPEGQVIVLDEGAIQASANATAQRAIRNLRIW